MHKESGVAPHTFPNLLKAGSRTHSLNILDLEAEDQKSLDPLEIPNLEYL